MHGVGLGFGITRRGVVVGGDVAPSNVVGPVASPSVVTAGEVISCTDGIWSGVPTPTYTYQWKRAGVDIGGETNSTYSSQEADVGAAITCAVTATNSQGSSTVSSNVVAVLGAGVTDGALFGQHLFGQHLFGHSLFDKGSGGGGGGSSPSEILIAAMVVPPSSARTSRIDTLINALITSGVWDKLDMFHILAAHDRQAAFLNWKSPGTFDLTEDGGVPGTFTVNRGYSGELTSYLRTHYIPSSDAVQLTQNEATLGCFIEDLKDNGLSAMGCREATTKRIILNPRMAEFLHMRINQDANNTTILNVGGGVAHICIRRNSDALIEGFRNASSLGTVAVFSTGLSPFELYYSANNGAGTVNSIDDRWYRGFYVGGRLTDIQITDVNTAFNAYMTGLGSD